MYTCLSRLLKLSHAAVDDLWERVRDRDVERKRRAIYIIVQIKSMRNAFSRSRACLSRLWNPLFYRCAIQRRRSRSPVPLTLARTRSLFIIHPALFFFYFYYFLLPVFSLSHSSAKVIDRLSHTPDEASHSLNLFFLSFFLSLASDTRYYTRAALPPAYYIRFFEDCVIRGAECALTHARG